MARFTAVLHQDKSVRLHKEKHKKISSFSTAITNISENRKKKKTDQKIKFSHNRCMYVFRVTGRHYSHIILLTMIRSSKCTGKLPQVSSTYIIHAAIVCKHVLRKQTICIPRSHKFPQSGHIIYSKGYKRTSC